MKDNLIEIATFSFPNDADVLQSLLQSEGIEYSVLGEDNPLVTFSEGIRLAVKESDVEKAIQVIKSAGFEKYLNEE